jgi:DNA-binding transcriptional LysR family regulator
MDNFLTEVNAGPSRTPDYEFIVGRRVGGSAPQNFDRGRRKGVNVVGVKLDWDRLKVFQAIADTGSITGAAQTLSRSYGKVSNDLDELERAIGRTLFDRTNRGLELKPFAQDLLTSVHAMTDTVTSIMARAGGRAPEKIVICAREGMASYWLARHLPELLDLNTDVQVFLKVLPNTPNLAAGDGDIAIQYEMPSSSEVISRQLGWLHYILYASPHYLAARGEPNELSDLHKHQILRLKSEEYQPDRWEAATSAWSAVLPDTMSTDASTVMVEACAAGAGIAAMPSYVSQCDPRLKPLVAIKPLSSVKFWLAYTERLKDTRSSEPVLRWIRSCFDPKRYSCFREVYVPPAANSNDPDPVGRAML